MAGKISGSSQNLSLIFLATILALGSLSCNSSASVDSGIVTASTSSNIQPNSVPIVDTREIEKTADAEVIKPEADNYEEALDIAQGANLLAKSATIREDWGLVASRWHEAIKILEAVPPSSPNHPNAQKNLSEYKASLAQALAKATPAPQPSPEVKGDTTPDFFLVPIKRHMANIPVVEISFNQTHKFEMAFDTGATKTLITGKIASSLALQPVGASLMKIADGSVVKLPLAVLDSISVDSRLKRDVTVAIAPNMPIGLLGQDFFAGYDVTIKKNVIEFQKR